MRMFNSPKTLSITAPESVSIGKLLPRFSAQRVLHLLDFLPWHGEAVTEGEIDTLPRFMASCRVRVSPSVTGLFYTVKRTFCRLKQAVKGRIKFQ